MKIKAIAPWFGGKRTMAPDIVKQIGPHEVYWEPFCGSMAVLMAKPVCRMETVNDLHRDLINLARVIRDPVAGAMFYRRLRRVWACDDSFRAARGLLLQEGGPVGDLDVGRAENYFIQSWLGMSGIAGSLAGEDGGRGIARRFTSAGGDSPTRFESAISSIPEWRARMRGIMILNGDAFEIISRIEDKEGTVIYADPPYIEKSEAYRHDFFGDDHQRLADLLGRFKRTRVVLSYYEHPEIDVMYPTWNKIDCSRSKIISNAGNGEYRGPTKAPEVLIVNGPAY